MPISSITTATSAPDARAGVGAMRDMMHDVAAVNPTLAEAVITMQEQLRDGEQLPPELMRALGGHIREVGHLVVGKSIYAETHPE